MNVYQVKRLVRERDGYRCTQCGMTNEEHQDRYRGKSLHVHRLKPGSVYTVEGCVTLCHRCHGPQPKRKRGEPDLGVSRQGQPLHFWLNEDVNEAFRRYLRSMEVKITATSAIEVALKEFLKNRGFWPPKS